MKINFKVFQDILKDKIDGTTAYSQARVYLLVSVVVFLTCLGVLFVKAIKPSASIDTVIIKQIIDALEWTIAFFGGYSMSTKIVDTAKIVMNKTPIIQKLDAPDAQPVPDAAAKQVL